MMKVCKKCGIPQSLENFKEQKTTEDGRYPWCMECCSKFSSPKSEFRHKIRDGKGRHVATPMGEKTAKILTMERELGVTFEEDYKSLYLGEKLPVGETEPWSQKRFATRWKTNRKIIFYNGGRPATSVWARKLGLPLRDDGIIVSPPDQDESSQSRESPMISLPYVPSLKSAPKSSVVSTTEVWGAPYERSGKTIHPINVKADANGWLPPFLVMSDLHAGSRSCEDVQASETIQLAYEEHGVEHIMMPGDVTQGFDDRKWGKDIRYGNPDGQIDHAHRIMTPAKGRFFHIIAGNHDEKLIERGDFGGLLICLWHPGNSGGKNPTNSLLNKTFASDLAPSILLCGHYHNAARIDDLTLRVIRFACPCWQNNETSWGHSLSREPSLGGFVIRARLEAGRMARFEFSEYRGFKSSRRLP